MSEKTQLTTLPIREAAKASLLRFRFGRRPSRLSGLCNVLLQDGFDVPISSFAGGFSERANLVKDLGFDQKSDVYSRHSQNGMNLAESGQGKDCVHGVIMVFSCHYNGGEFPMAANTVCTYFIQGVNGGAVKIGITSDLRKRLQQMQIGSPAKLHVVGCLKGNYESELHELFSGSRLHGEWFKPSPELVNYIADSCPVETRPTSSLSEDTTGRVIANASGGEYIPMGSIRIRLIEIGNMIEEEFPNEGPWDADSWQEAIDTIASLDITGAVYIDDKCSICLLAPKGTSLVLRQSLIKSAAKGFWPCDECGICLRLVFFTDDASVRDVWLCDTPLLIKENDVSASSFRPLQFHTA